MRLATNYFIVTIMATTVLVCAVQMALGNI